jgi:hypothetical protein
VAQPPVDVVSTAVVVFVVSCNSSFISPFRVRAALIEERERVCRTEYIVALILTRSSFDRLRFRVFEPRILGTWPTGGGGCRPL